MGEGLPLGAKVWCLSLPGGGDARGADRVQRAPAQGLGGQGSPGVPDEAGAHRPSGPGECSPLAGLALPLARPPRLLASAAHSPSDLFVCITSGVRLWESTDTPRRQLLVPTVQSEPRDLRTSLLSGREEVE